MHLNADPSFKVSTSIYYFSEVIIRNIYAQHASYFQISYSIYIFFNKLLSHLKPRMIYQQMISANEISLEKFQDTVRRTSQ